MIELCENSMVHCISIDWLSLHCRAIRGGFEHAPAYDGTIAVSTSYEYETAEHGTRQFKHLDYIRVQNEDFCEVQYDPCSQILKEDTVIVKFSNRLLYQHNLWELVDNFLRDHELMVRGISRVDVCADFNKFETYEPVQLISDFLSSKLRHKGKGLGAAYFNHFAKKMGAFSVAHLLYSGISFGSRESDARAYLYNKSFELRTVKDKPYIRQFWQEAGLNTAIDVWRLEISIKSKGTRFKDKKTKTTILIDEESLKQPDDLCKLFYTYQKKLFTFVYNRAGITNITREPTITLFKDVPHYKHGVIRNVSCSSRTERILIKQLWQLSQRYRGNDMIEDEGICKSLAKDLAAATCLNTWLDEKKRRWKKPVLK